MLPRVLSRDGTGSFFGSLAMKKMQRPTRGLWDWLSTGDWNGAAGGTGVNG